MLAWQRGLVQGDELRLQLEEMAGRQGILISPALVEGVLREVVED